MNLDLLKQRLMQVVPWLQQQRQASQQWAQNVAPLQKLVPANPPTTPVNLPTEQYMQQGKQTLNDLWEKLKGYMR